MLEKLDYIIRIGSTPTFLYFDLYLYYAYAAHYVYISIERIYTTDTYLFVIESASFHVSLTNDLFDAWGQG